MPAVDPIVIVRETPAPPAVVWESLVDPDRVRHWFTDVSPVTRVGDPYRIDFGDSAVEGVVTDLEPGHRLGYTWAWAGETPRVETRVSWQVDGLQVTGSRITFRHDGWTEADADEATRDDHAGYWRDYLDELIAVLGSETAAPG